MPAVPVDCPCCSGSGEHVIDTRDPQDRPSFVCGPCAGRGYLTAQAARELRLWLAEHAPGPTPHPTPTVPADPFLGPPGPEPF